MASATLIDPAKLPQQYAAYTEGDCMSPMIGDRTLLAFDTSEQPRRGDVIGLWFRPAAIEFGSQLRVKRLVKMTAETIVVDMLNPPRLLSYVRSDIFAVHKCVGRIDETSGYRMSSTEHAASGFAAT